MGLGGISIWQLLIVLAIVILLFGTKKLKNIGSDLGGAVRGFKNSMKDAENAPKEDDAAPEKLEKADDDKVIEGQATHETDKPKN